MVIAIHAKSQMKFIQISNHSFAFMYYILALRKNQTVDFSNDLWSREKFQRASNDYGLKVKETRRVKMKYKILSQLIF